MEKETSELDSELIPKVDWLYYEFQVYSPTENLPEGPGLYVFAAPGSKERWFPLYIGSCESLAGLLPNHQYWYRAGQLEATHIHVREEPQKEIRLKMEQELIRYYKPRLNDLQDI